MIDTRAGSETSAPRRRWSDSIGLVRAAGGILWREGPRGPKLAVIHRPRKADWSLPKGKLERGEGWEAAALREVEEETGCRAGITSFAGAAFYTVRRGPKIVLYWHMALLREGAPRLGEEVDEVAWLTPEGALKRLDHERERRLLEGACSAVRARSGRDAPPAAEIAAIRAELLRRIVTLPAKANVSLVEPVIELLDDAEEALKRGDLERARRLVAAARIAPA